MMAWGPITVEGRTPQPGEAFINVDQRIVSTDYFRAMQIPLRRGRLFGEQDIRSAPRVVVIDERMADELWPNQDPIGRRVRRGGFDANSTAPWMTVVGVVGRVKQDALDAESRAAMYLPHLQFPTRALTVVVRGPSSPEALTESVRQQIRALDPELPMYRVTSMADAARRVAGRAAVLDAAAGAVCRARPGAGDHRHLRRDGVLRHARHARARDSHGAGRLAARDSAARRRPGRRVAAAGWSSAWRGASR